MDDSILLFKRDITDAMIRLDDSTMLSSDLIPEPIKADIGKLLEQYGQSLFDKMNNQSLLNDDARIKGDCNDNDTPLEDYNEYSQTHTVHRDDDGERN